MADTWGTPPEDEADKRRLAQCHDNLYLYDVSDDHSRKISFDAAQNLAIINNFTSPDGFQITQTDSGMFFSLQGKLVKQFKVPLGIPHLNGQPGDLHLLGWIQR